MAGTMRHSELEYTLPEIEPSASLDTSCSRWMPFKSPALFNPSTSLVLLSITLYRLLYAYLQPRRIHLTRWR